MMYINNLIQWHYGEPFPQVDKVFNIQVDGDELNFLREVVDIDSTATLVTFRNAGQWNAAQEIYDKLRNAYKGTVMQAEHHVTTYIVNPKTNRVHRAIDGKTHENCNIDQLTSKVILTQEQFDAFGAKYVKCVRCFRV